MRMLRLLLWPAGVALGVGAERIYVGWADPRDWVPDLLTGLTLITCGLIAWSRRAESRSGALLTATGFTWFAGNFAASGIGAIDWLAVHAVYLHRGPLVQLVLTYPRGRAVGGLQRAVIGAAYVAAVISPVARSEVLTIVLAAVVIGVAAWSYLRAVGRERRTRVYALQASAFVGLMFAGTAAVHIAFPTGEADRATLLAYQAGLCALSVGALVTLLEAPWERAALTDLVVELGEKRSGTVGGTLAHALGDPTLEVAYRLHNGEGYVDATGRPVELPTSDSDRRVTPLERDGEEVAMLVHSAGVLDDPALVEAVAAAARLAASNVRLQAEVLGRVTELQASRRRLVVAADEERRRLEQRLSEGAVRRLATLGEVLETAYRRATPEVRGSIERAASQLERTLAGLHELAAGLHPRELAGKGVGDALASLAERSPVAVQLEVERRRLPDEVEAAVFFVCSEALANVAKHASASVVSITLNVENEVASLEIADDGIGGADPASGSGLRGLADRAEALGGTLIVESPPGRGTRLVAEWPLVPRFT
jgi:signal transduction histidine kinase